VSLRRGADIRRAAQTVDTVLATYQMVTDKWKALFSDLETQEESPAMLPARVERDFRKIAANRAKNLEIAQKLQEDLLEVVQKLRDYGGSPEQARLRVASLSATSHSTRSTGK
jgi:2-oxoglutarate dehydrogenase complex dehydrogenase (E1) component-like enzyme